MLLADWYHDLSDTVYARYLRTGAFPSCVDSLLANGQGRVRCLPRDLLDCGPDLCGEAGIAYEDTTATANASMDQTMPSMSAMSMSSTPMSSMPAMSISAMEPTRSLAGSSAMGRQRRQMTGMSSMTDSSSTMLSDTMSISDMSSTMDMESMTTSNRMGMSTMTMPNMSMSTSTDMSGMNGPLGPRGCMPPSMFRPGFNASSLPRETCTNTATPLLQIQANASSGWLALNLVNAGSTSKLSVSLDSHTMYVYAADGMFVEMQEVKVRMLRFHDHIRDTVYKIVRRSFQSQ